MVTTPAHSILTRRSLFKAAASTVIISAFPSSATASPTNVETAQNEIFGDRTINEGRVNLKLPSISENGYTVPIEIDVDSPMTSDDYVKKIAILSEKNPVTTIAVYDLTPQSGTAKIESRIRLGGTQTVAAIAEMSDGTLWSGSAHTVVTLAACIIL